MIPEPITIARSRAVPSISATTRRVTEKGMKWRLKARALKLVLDCHAGWVEVSLAPYVVHATL